MAKQPKTPQKPATPAKIGRPSTFTPQLVDELCERLASGQSQNAISKRPGMPAAITISEWMADTKNPEKVAFAAKYVRAREAGYQILASEILEIANTPIVGRKTKLNADGEVVEVTESDMIEHRRLQVDTRKWFLSKVLPKMYGDKLDVAHSGEVAVTLVVNRLTPGAK